MDASGPSSLAATSSSNRASGGGFFTAMFNRNGSGVSPLASSQSNSQTNDQLTAATSTAKTNTNLSGSFDRSDFPSLGSLSFGNGTFLTASGQQRPQQHQQRLVSGVGAEDFPSLLASSSLSATGAGIAASSSSLARQSSSSSATSQTATTTKVHALGAIVPQSQPTFPQRSIPGNTNSNITATEKINGIPLPSNAPASSTAADFGLISLLKLIRMSDNQRNSLALGKDPTLLGWNGDPALFLGSRYSAISATTMPTKSIPAAPALVTAPSTNSAPPIAAAISTSSTKPADDPNYQLPICYYVSPPALKTGHFAKFQLETVFYIFYALPRDVLQAYAAQELYHREWRYHSDHKLWFKRVAPSDGISSLAASSTVNYMYFDLQSWERRLFTGIMNSTMKQGFLSEDMVAVHFTSS